MKNFYKCTLIAVSLALITAAGLASCTPEDQTGPVTPPTKKYDVYVAGYEINDSGKPAATLWKNSKATSLSEGTDIFSQAISVFVAGEYVYVAGFEGSNATLWKIGTDLNTDNLTQVALSSSSYAYSVFVAGNDVYVAGKEGSNATLWKIGTDLNTGNLTKVALSSSSQAWSVFVAGDDVYVAGEESSEGTKYAKLWKINKDFTTTTPINNVTLASNTVTSPAARSVFVSGDVVYIAGCTSDAVRESVSTLWKINKDLSPNDLTITDLSNESIFSEAISVYVLGNYAYIAGYDAQIINNNPQTVANWWKVSKDLTSSTNPTSTSLTEGSSEAAAASIFVKER